MYLNIQNSAKAGFEVQWYENDDFKKLRWFQTDDRKSGRNKIFLFLTSSDRKTGLLKVNIKIQNFFKSLRGHAQKEFFHLKIKE